MKRFLSLVVRGALYGVAFYALMCMVLLYVFGHSSIQLPVLIGMSFVPLAIFIVVCIIASRTSRITDEESCKREFADVAQYGKIHIIVFSFMEIILLCVALYVNYSGAFRFDKDYVHAQELLVKDYGANYTTLIIGKSLPSWAIEKSMIGADSISNAQHVYIDAEGATEQEEKVNEIADDMDAKFATVRTYKICGLLSAWLLGVLVSIIKRIQMYHSTMKALKKGGK